MARHSAQALGSALPAATYVQPGSSATNGDGTAYIGPFFYCRRTRSRRLERRPRADTAVWSDPVRFMRDYLEPGDIFVPLNGDSRYYVKTASRERASPLTQLALMYAIYCGEFRDMAHVGTTYYCIRRSR